MREEVAAVHEQIEVHECAGPNVEAWLGREPEDEEWDAFLQTTPLGQYQQSSMWARAKATEGWRVARAVMVAGEEIVGGFQVLYKSSWWGGIGYVSKGPVVEQGSGELARFGVELLEKVCARLRLRALVVQLPDESDAGLWGLAGRGFLNYAAGKVIESTWLIGLGRQHNGTQKAMTANTRREVRQAIRRGIRVREGKREDLPVFFELMRSSCRRQQTRPNPGDVASLFRLWDAAESQNCIRLLLAEHEGVPLGGLVCIQFGRTMSAWKKGWREMKGHPRPNELLNYECLKWAAENGCDQVDFGSFDDVMAVAVLRGEPVSEESKASRHFFNMRFGGRPAILPAAMIYIPNPLLRLAYRIVFGRKIRSSVERRRAMDAVGQAAHRRVEASV
ncbi:MAG: GNAT family N-acetyltransferase [Bryobacteraceae bacterium]|nr:GNAT family N-acetyltransferase [Bryobacteraceae bacterium]